MSIESYSKDIIKNVLKELSGDISLDSKYGECELELECELENYKDILPALAIDEIKGNVRSYLFNHNYLEYVNMFRNNCEYSYDSDNDVVYVKLDLDGWDLEYCQTESVDGLLVDVSSNGVVRGVEILDASKFLQLSVDELERVGGVVVKSIVKGDVVWVRVALFVDGMMRQRWGTFLNVYNSDDVLGGCFLFIMG